MIDTYNMISGPVERLRECYRAMTSEALSEEDWLIVALTVITTVFDWLNDVTDIRHNALSLNKTASVFYLFHYLFAIKYANNA